jgi:hypothetical protein
MSKDSVITSYYLHGGRDNDSLLMNLHQAGLIDDAYYVNSLSTERGNSERKRLARKYASRDSATIVRLRSALKHKFLVDFAISHFGLPSEFSLLYDDRSYQVVQPEKPNILESLRYDVLLNLYPLTSLDSNYQMFALPIPYIEGPLQLFLLSADNQGNIVLDSLDLDPRSATEIDTFSLNKHSLLQMKYAIHGTGYLDEQITFVGAINNRFRNLFSTSLLQANDWTMPLGNPKNEFLRRTAVLSFSDVDGDGILDITKHVSEDLITMTKNIKNFDFQNAQVKKHIRDWVEIYVWNEKLLAFNLDKSRSSIITSKK